MEKVQTHGNLSVGQYGDDVLVQLFLLVLLEREEAESEAQGVSSRLASRHRQRCRATSKESSVPRDPR
jgi:hypothetical protein